MRMPSPPLVVPLVAFAFLGGWLTASWVSPPTAVTQERPARVTAPPVEVPMPRVALAAVTAPRTSPSAHRNPFTFAGAPARALESPRTRAELETDAVVAVDASAAVETPVVEATPPWRVIGIASAADGGFTAVVSGAGDVFLLAPGTRLPDGAMVIEVGAAFLVLERADGSRETLRLP